MWSLNNTNGRFLAVGPSAEYQDGLGERTGHDNFIVNRIKCKTVDGPADLGLLTL